MQWYYTVQGQRQGPVEDAVLEDLVRQQVIGDDTYVWREGLAEWQLYGAVKPKPAPERAPVPVPAAKPVDAAGEGGFGAPSQARPYTPPSRSARPYTAPQAVAKPAPAGSQGYFFYYPVLRALGDGRGIRGCVVWGLKIGAAAVVLAGLLGGFEVLSGSRGSRGGEMVGAVLLAVLALATSLCVAQVCWYRAGAVAALGESDYFVIPIASILFRAAGECSATAFAGIGVGMCLFQSLSPAGLGGILPFGLQATTGVVNGIGILLYTGLLAFLSLILGYLAAEWTGLLVDIADSIRKIRKVAEKAE